jgi:hypothetical protein
MSGRSAEQLQLPRQLARHPVRRIGRDLLVDIRA